MGLLEVFEDQFKWTKFPLRSVRKFITQDVVLSEIQGLHPAKPEAVSRNEQKNVPVLLVE